MKYKVGDEVLVKARITSVFSTAYTADCSCGNFYLKNEDILQEPQMNADEAWEIAKRICTSDYDGCDNWLSDRDLDEIFGISDCGIIMNRYTQQQAKEKIEAWEAAKEIEIGDFAEFEDKIFCVTRILGDYYCGIDENGSVYSAKKKCIKKTGRHIDIEGLLRNIGGIDA